MQTTTAFISGYKVTVFTSHVGIQLFITDTKGVQIYAHKVSSDPLGRAREVIAAQ